MATQGVLAMPDRLPYADGSGWVSVFYDGTEFAIEEPLTGWWIVVLAWSRARFAARVGHLDIVAWRDDAVWLMALPECGGVVRLEDRTLQRLLADQRQLS